MSSNTYLTMSKEQTKKMLSARIPKSLYKRVQAFVKKHGLKRETFVSEAVEEKLDKTS